MSREQINATVQDIFRDVLDSDTLVIEDSLTAADVDGWDSLSHISIVSAIEKHYGIRFTLGELDSFNDIGDLIGMIEKKLSR